MTKAQLHPPIARFLAAREEELSSIPEARRGQLERVAGWVKAQRTGGRPAHLVFICTHNSRRSHISQLWAHALVQARGLSGVRTFSGGTEATAFNPRAVAAMRRAGFQISSDGEGDNPRYAVSVGADADTAEAYSKVYDAPENPAQDFAAIMTCTDADRGCPVVLGASLREVIAYDDPKASDGRPEESRTYDERVAQIAREMLYMVSRV